MHESRSAPSRLGLGHVSDGTFMGALEHFWLVALFDTHNELHTVQDLALERVY